MRVKEIVIDGFKSYATRTVITDWDPQFNCITGLNGSGKSNILDAICFVLGITTLSAVRAQNQQDLIYKRGQAGVTKASVSIVFDNSDKSNTPLDFKNVDTITVTRQVVLGGTSKYLVNGHRAQQNQVQQLFQSVQLNINNPNFLIMQGQITKVVNMRPREILALIEEAAGTGMYEKERLKALKEIQDRDAPMASTQALLTEEIAPKLEELRHKKREFLEFQQCSANVEKMQRLAVSSKFLHLEARLRDASSANQRREDRLAELHNIETSRLSEIDAIEESLASLRDVLGGGDVLSTLERELVGQQEEHVRKQVHKEDAERELADKLAQQKEYEQLQLAAQQEYAAYQAEIGEFHSQIQTHKADLDEVSALVTAKRGLLRSIETGISENGERETGYAGAVKHAREKVVSLQNQLANTVADIATKRDKLDNPDELHQQLVKHTGDHEKLAGQIAHLERILETAGESAARQAQLHSEEVKLRDAASAQRREMERFVASHPQLEVPEIPGVLGRVGHLMIVPEEHANKAVALEVVAGSQMWNVVVDNDETSARLLKTVRRRLVVLPLNKLRSRRLAESQVRQIESKAGGGKNSVWLAVDLVGYESPELQIVAEYVFGNTLVCSTDAVAQHAAFKQGFRAVTIAGDLYDPRGSISGGFQSSNKGPSKFALAAKHNVMWSQTRATEAEAARLQAEAAELQDAAAAAAQAKTELEIVRYEASLVAKHLSSAQERADAAKSTQADIARMEQDVDKLKHDIGAAQEAVAKVEKDAAEFAENREEKVRELQAQLAEAVARQTQLREILDQNGSRRREVEDRLMRLKHTEEGEKERLAKVAETIAELSANVEAVSKDIEVLEKTSAELEAKVAAERARISSVSSELRASEERISKCQLELQEARLESQELNSEGGRDAEHLSGMTIALSELKKKYPWLETDRDMLGVPGGPYYMEGMDSEQEMAQLQHTLAAEEKRLATLQSKVNPAVVSMIERLERDESGVREKLHTIIEDKRKLEESIALLDTRRQDTINRVWQEVSDNFGLILGDLLPQASAQLVPMGSPIENGFTIKVRLGNQWKEGLTELSGGQRSLVALSLILALLNYHPAPMYILDEVDAALDVHHTRNIGHIIKTRFRNSQFIVVSLKDDMFTNANRIYQARFQEGTSTVSILV